MIRINIPRPIPGTNENAEQIAFIEPLMEAETVSASSAYLFNYKCFVAGEECSYSPGFKYTFGFINEEDAVAFMLKFNGEIIR